MRFCRLTYTCAVGSVTEGELSSTDEYAATQHRVRFIDPTQDRRQIA